ncbi:hypothetical protein AB0H49_18515 [Nocardia sp. NPDC050713]
MAIPSIATTAVCGHVTVLSVGRAEERRRAVTEPKSPAAAQ